MENNTDKLYTTLKNYWTLLFPLELEENEFVRIWGETPEGEELIRFIKSVEELHETVLKYRFHYNLYINLSTTKGNDKGKAENLFNRHVLALDFDKKDFDGETDYKYFLKLVKEKFPTLYYHAIVDSGGGFHFYFAIKSTQDHEKIAKITKTIVQSCGADVRAALTTQIFRIPGSFNLKYEPMKIVSVIHNAVNDLNFKQTSLRSLMQIENNARISDKPISTKNYSGKCFCNHFCIQQVLKNGTTKGRRNFWLGRITKMLQVRGYDFSKAMEIALDYNERCSPSKRKKEIMADFTAFWEYDYKLLGCRIDDPIKQGYIDEVCDKYQCKVADYYEDALANYNVKVVQLDNMFWNNSNIKRFEGIHFVILIAFLLNKCGTGMNFNQIESFLTNGSGGHSVTEKTIRKKLNELCCWGYLECTLLGGCRPHVYSLKPIPNYRRGYTDIRFDICEKLIDKIITPKEFLTYITLWHKLQRGERVSLCKLATLLHIDQSNVSKLLHRLQGKMIISIKATYHNKGYYWNRYIFN